MADQSEKRNLKKRPPFYLKNSRRMLGYGRVSAHLSKSLWSEISQTSVDQLAQSKEAELALQAFAVLTSRYHDAEFEDFRAKKSSQQERRKIRDRGKIDTGAKGKRKKKFKVTKGRPSIGNFCKQADILRVVSSRQRGITYCYERELARNPELGGKVTGNWNIGLNGKVMEVWVEASTLKNGTVESCMTRSIKRWKFTKPDGGVCQTRFPFLFE
jgi:hypothetical protein